MTDFFNYFRELNTASTLLRLALAMLFGGIIGLERGRKHRAAGFRTHMLVCLGAALAMLLGQYEYHMVNEVWTSVNTSIDVSRFGAQVINGIGFLGAGTVIVTARQDVKGLTTAAGLWASACTGLAIGAGFYECVILAFLLITLVVRALPALELLFIEKSTYMNVYIEFTSLDDMGEIINCIKSQNIQIYEVEIDRGKEKNIQRPNAIFSIRLKQRQAHTKLLAALSELESIHVIEELR